MAQDTAENGLMMLTERGQDNQLKAEATRCTTNLMTQKRIIKGKHHRI